MRQFGNFIFAKLPILLYNILLSNINTESKMTKILAVFILITLIACNDPDPVPALTLAKGNLPDCKLDKCSTYIGDFPPIHYAKVNYPDSNYDSILGHHDYSIE